MDQTPGSDIAQGVVGDLSSLNPIMALIKLLTSAMPAQVAGPQPMPMPMPGQQGTNPISGVPSGLKGAMLGGQQKPPLQY